MVFDITFRVNGIGVKLRPYTIAAFDRLQAVNAEMEAYEAEQALMPEAIDRKKRAGWWKRKAEILWEPESKLDDTFFLSDDFERSYLIQSEDFFTAWHWRR